MIYQDCSYVLNASGGLVSSSCQSNPYAFDAFSGSTQWVSVAHISPDGTIGLNRDLTVHTDFLMHVIVFPIVGLYAFWRMFVWFVSKF